MAMSARFGEVQYSRSRLAVAQPLWHRQHLLAVTIFATFGRSKRVLKDLLISSSNNVLCKQDAQSVSLLKKAGTSN
jgi:hypothetical protein